MKTIKTVLLTILCVYSVSTFCMEPATPDHDALFKKNFQQQLLVIKKSLDGAIASEMETTHINNNWLTAFDCVNATAINTHLQLIQQTIVNKNHPFVAYFGDNNEITTGIYEELSANPHIFCKMDKSPHNSVDVLLAPYTLHSHMDTIFKNCQSLLRKPNSTSLKEHVLFNCFEKLSDDGVCLATLCSGPTIDDMTNILLGKHDLHLSPTNQPHDPSLKIFNSVETFFRCLDIFKPHYQRATGKSIKCDLSFAFSHIPLNLFCRKYVKQHPELLQLSAQEREKFIRLLSIFTIKNNILDLSITLKMSAKQNNTPIMISSFKPIELLLESDLQKASNEIELGQQILDRQIQNLNGSEIAMLYIKDADGVAQLKALQSVFGRREHNIVDLGGGRGETNAVLKAIKDTFSHIELLNVEPHAPFAATYIYAHDVVGIPNVKVLQKKAQDLTTSDVIDHFHGQQIDILFASHSFYFLLTDLYKASLTPELPLNQHPLWKYFEMLRDDGVLMITLQSGAGARLFRNALLGNHGLNTPTDPTTDETTSLLSSFGNMATLLRAFEHFSQRYQNETCQTITIKMHYDVANVPLGKFVMIKDSETGGFKINNPTNDPNMLALKMMDFYGNWKELQTLATLTLEKAQAMSPEELKKLGIDTIITEEIIKAKREAAIKSQTVFLHILPLFAPARKNMQHPNITLEIRKQS